MQSYDHKYCSAVNILFISVDRTFVSQLVHIRPLIQSSSITWFLKSQEKWIKTNKKKTVG